MPTTEDQRARRADERRRRREQASTTADESPSPETDGSGEDGVGQALAGSPVRTGATLAAAGALVGAAIGAANAIRSRADQVNDEGSDGDEPATAEQEPHVEDREEGEEPASVESSSDDADADEGEQEEEEPRPQPAAEVDEAEVDEGERDGRPGFAEGTPGWVAQRARDQMGELTGLEVEGVLGLERTDGGWLTRVEVVELHRIPSTTDVLGVFEVELDEKGAIANFQRTERYVRSQGGGGGS